MSDLALILRADVKTELGIEGSGDDDVIDRLIPAVSRDVEGYCKRDLKREAALIEVKNGSGTDRILVLRPPINSLTSVHVSTDVPRAYDADSLIDADDLEFDAEAGLIYRIDGGTFSRERNSTRVEYDGGLWANQAAVPEDVQRVAIEILQVKLSKGTEKQYHLTSESREGGSLSGIRFDDIPEHAKAVLDRYRLVR